jgi:hypothetical protein
MKRIGVFVVLFGCFVSAAWAQNRHSAFAPSWTIGRPSLVLYDDFNSRWIDPAKWTNWGDLEGVLHAVIDLAPSYQGQGNDRQLRIFQRANSMTYENPQDVRWGWLGLQATYPD